MIVVGALPIVTTVMACGLHPFLRARSFASQSVNEPAANAISVPAPTPISILPATIACVILLPPVKSTIVRSRPCFLKMPSLSPTLTGMIGSAFGAALPTVSIAAVAGVHPAMIDPMVIANAASNRPRHRILIMVLPHLWSGVLVAIAWIGLMFRQR